MNDTLTFGHFPIIMKNEVVDVNDVVCYSSCRIAASRAVETERGDDALVKDPLAFILASSALQERKEKYSDNTTDSTWRIAIRTKYFDDYVESKRDVIEQVVLLGAGMDTRAHRLLLGTDVIFYELDQQNVLDWKTKLLNLALSSNSNGRDDDILRNMIQYGNERTRRIGCNLESQDGKGWGDDLSQSDFDPKKSTLWILEGLTYYLSNDIVVSNLFQTMRKMSSGSTSSSCIVSIATRSSVQRASSSSTDKLMQAWKWGHDDPNTFLLQNGWNCEDVVTLGDESKANYGRYPQTMNNKKSGIMYVTATLKL